MFRQYPGFLAALAVFAIAIAIVMSPVVVSDGHRTFTLQLTQASASTIKELGYHDQWDKAKGDGLCALYKELDAQHVTNEVFRTAPLSPDGRFSVSVATFGRERFWGLWRTQGMFNYVVLRAVLATAKRFYKCVPVTCEEPIPMIDVEPTAAASASLGP